MTDKVAEGARGRYVLERSDDALENKRAEHMLCVLRAAARRRYPDLGFDFVLVDEPDGVYLLVGIRSPGVEARYSVHLGQDPAGDDFARAERQMLSLIGSKGDT